MAVIKSDPEVRMQVGPKSWKEVYWVIRVFGGYVADNLTKGGEINSDIRNARRFNEKSEAISRARAIDDREGLCHIVRVEMLIDEM